MNGNPSRAQAWLTWAQTPRDQGGLGLAPHQAAGVVGNLVNESGADLNPWGPTGDKGTAMGTAQWRLDRLARLKALYPDTYQTMEGQQAFMRHELDTSEAKAYDAIRTATSPEAAARAFDQLYERSDGSTRTKREAAARNLMDQFGGGGAPDDGALAYASTPKSTGSKSMPALSADSLLGPGALGASYGDPMADGLIGIGASLAGITNPDQAKAMTAQLVASQKAPADRGTWSIHTDPNGNSVYFNNKTGQTIARPGNYAKPQEDEYVKEANKASAKSNQELGDTINQNARDSANIGQTVAEIRSALQGANSPDQGIFGPARQYLEKTYAAFGFGDPAKVANGDIASALSNKLALQLVNSGGVKLLPGSFSDSDRKFVTQMATSLSNSPEANQRLLDIYERANRNVQEAEALRAVHVAKSGGIIMPSFRSELADLSTKQLKAAQDEAAARAKTAPAAATSPNTKSFKTKSGVSWSVQ